MEGALYFLWNINRDKTVIQMKDKSKQASPTGKNTPQRCPCPQVRARRACVRIFVLDPESKLKEREKGRDCGKPFPSPLSTSYVRITPSPKCENFSLGRRVCAPQTSLYVEATCGVASSPPVITSAFLSFYPRSWVAVAAHTHLSLRRVEPRHPARTRDAVGTVQKLARE